MSRRGNPYDNAVAENFFNCLKCEFVHFQYVHSRLAEESAIFRYIEAYYNALSVLTVGLAGLFQTPLKKQIFIRLHKIMQS